MATAFKNPHLKDLSVDYLYHLGLSTEDDLTKRFGDVRVVVMGGTDHRMKTFAKFLMKELNLQKDEDEEPVNLTAHSHRFAMFKVGPVLSVSHGMGIGSISICLHEIIKLLWHSGAKDPYLFRMGTCGGIGLEPGTVVVSTAAVDGMLREVSESVQLCKRVARPAILDQSVAQKILDLAPDFTFTLRSGKTMCCNDFYEEQARLDGAFCEYNVEDKMKFLKLLHDNGVTNIEMECTVFASLTHRAGVKSGVINVTLIDRLNGDQVETPKEIMLEWQCRPQEVLAKFIKNLIKEESA